MTAILINKTFDEITPESAERGDVSESGFYLKRQPYTFRELVGELRDLGIQGDNGLNGSAYGTPYVDSYATMTEISEAIHFHPDNPERLRKWFDLAVKVALRS